MKATTTRILYIAVAWIFLVCYSILLFGAAESIINLSNIAPSDKNTKQIIIFLYGLAVVSFLGGTQVPAVFLKKKSFIIQFVFSATFGFILLQISNLNETLLKPFNATVMPFFISHPIVALEYLSIPYLFMVFLDFYLSERLSAFSWTRFGRFLKGAFLRPRSTLKEVGYHRSILFSLVAVTLVSVAWIVRNVAFSQAGFSPARKRFFSLSLGEPLNLVSKVTVVTPMVLLTWVIVSALVHMIARKIDGRGGYSETMALIGFAFLPSVLTIAVDSLEYGLQLDNSLLPSAAFLILGFLIPIVLWPLALVIFAVQISQEVSALAAGFTAATTFLPLFILITQVFL